jgi:S1-C subfamily serine protease
MTDATPPEQGQRSSYSPPPSQRPAWLAQGWGGTDKSRAQRSSLSSGGSSGPWPPQGSAPQGSAPQAGGPPRWPDPARRPDPRRQPRGTAAPSSSRRSPLPFAAAVLAAALGAAALASVGTYALLSVGGHLQSRNSVPPVAETASALQPTSRVADRVRVVEQSAITEAARAVSPAVVTITSEVDDGSSRTLFPTGVGSGVIYDRDGWVVTNRHVVCGATRLVVRLADGQRFPATTYGVDTLTDLAIVRIDGGGGRLPAAALGDSATIEPGQLAVAIGSPLGTFTNSVTSGVISAKGRSIEVNDQCAPGGMQFLRNLVQTDAAINPGNSGGALVDASGTVIGINTAVAGDAQGIGFAIPINLAKPIMYQAVEGRELRRPYMGVYYADVTPALAGERDLPIDYGVLIEAPLGTADPAVLPDSPADRAGIRSGDIITAINGQRVDGHLPLDEILTQYDAEDELALQVLRGGRTIELTLQLGTRPTN